MWCEHKEYEHLKPWLIIDDASRLVTCFSVIPKGLVELGEFAQSVDQNRWSSVGISRKVIALEKLAQMYLPKPLKKGMGAFSAWDHSYLTAAAKLCMSQFQRQRGS